MAQDQQLPCTSTGFRFVSDVRRKLALNQFACLNQLIPLKFDATFLDFAPLHMKLSWLPHSYSDVLLEVAQLREVIADRFKKERPVIMKGTNLNVRYAQQNLFPIHFWKLHLSGLQISHNSDASFAASVDLSSQLGYFVVVGDNCGVVIPIQFKSYNARRVVHSAKAANLIAFGGMCDAAYKMAEELRFLHPSSNLLMKLYTGNKSSGRSKSTVVKTGIRYVSLPRVSV